MRSWWSCLVLAWVAAAGAVTVEGTVVDAQGKPVPGVTVGASAFSEQAKVRAVVATSDAAGAFRLDIPGNPNDGDMAIVALAPKAIAFYAGPVAAKVLLTTQPATSLSGELLDDKGARVAGATIRVLGLQSRPTQRNKEGAAFAWPEEPFPPLKAVTDAQGKFTLTPLLLGGSLEAIIQHPDYLDESLHAGEVGKAKLEVPRLRRGGAIAGRVARADGTPVAGVKVGLLDGPMVSDRAAVTDADGRYTLGGLDTGVYAVALTDPTGPVTSLPRHRVRVKIGEVTKGIDLEAIKGVLLTVKVVDAETGKPLADVVVHGGGSQGPLPGGGPLSTNADGQLQLRLPPGQVNVWAQPLDGWLEGPASHGEARLIPIKAPEPVVLKLVQGRALTGILRDDGGEPQAGCRLEFEFGEGEADVRGSAQAVTDGEGRYRVSALPRKGPLTVTVIDVTGFRRHEEKLQADKLPKGDWTLAVPRLEKLGLRGKVVGGDGKPLQGAMVLLTLNENGPVDAPRLDQQNTETDTQGGYVFNGLPRVEGYQVKAMLKGHRLRAAVPVKTKDTLTVEPLVLDALVARVTGRVLDADNKLAAGATVMALGLRGIEAVTAGDGSFTLKGLPAGKLRLLALHGRDAVGEVSTEAGATEAVVRVRPQRPLSIEDQHDLAADLLRQVWKLAKETDGDRAEGLRTLARVDPPGVVEALNDVGGKDEDRAEVISVGLLALASAAPAVCVEHLAVLRKIQDKEQRAALQARLGAMLCRTQRDAASKLYDQIRDTRLDDNPEFGCYKAALAGLLGRAEAGGLADRQVRTFAKEEDTRSMLGMAAFIWAELPALRDRAIAALPEDQRTRPEMLSVLGLVRADAKAALARLDQVLTPEARRHWEENGAEDPLFVATLGSLLVQLAPSDPATAARLCALAPEETRAKVLAGTAALVKDRDAAVKFIREAAALGEALEPPIWAFCAVTAQAIDPTTADKLYEAFLRDVDENMAHDAQIMVLAAREPNRARKLLERRLAPEPEETEATGEAGDELLLAACHVDIKRAVEVAQAVNDAELRVGLFQRVARWLSQPPALRAMDMELVEFVLHTDLHLPELLADVGR